MPGTEIACNASATLTQIAGVEHFLGSPLHEVTAQATGTSAMPEFSYQSAIDFAVMVLNQLSTGTMKIEADL